MALLKIALLGAAASFAFAAPAIGHMQMNMPGMKMPIPKKAPAKKKAAPAKKKGSAAKGSKTKSSTKKTTPTKPAATSHAMHGAKSMPGMAMKPGETMQAMPGMQMPQGLAMPVMQMSPGQPMPGMQMPQAQSTPNVPGMAMPGMEAPTGTDLPAGNASAPPPPADHAADRTFPPAVMARARDQFRTEQGGQSFHQVLFNLAEIQIRNGRNGYRWDGEAWFGGDINRLVVKSEGEGTFHKGVGSAEAQALYSRAIGPYFNLQAGVRHDFAPTPTRTYATVGVEGLAPYMFDTEAALFLSTKGDVLARAEGWYDERITQRLVLQPRVELNFAAQDVPEDRLGAGLTDAELGLRIRYEIRREFAPYIGISYEAKTGRTATFARRAGEDVHATSLVLGIGTWF